MAYMVKALRAVLLHQHKIRKRTSQIFALLSNVNSKTGWSRGDTLKTCSWEVLVLNLSWYINCSDWGSSFSSVPSGKYWKSVIKWPTKKKALWRRADWLMLQLWWWKNTRDGTVRLFRFHHGRLFGTSSSNVQIKKNWNRFNNVFDDLSGYSVYTYETIICVVSVPSCVCYCAIIWGLMLKTSWFRHQIVEDKKVHVI
jgi:hypothetical protein